MLNIRCEWSGRNDDRVIVFGASNIEEAKQAAMSFSEYPFEGITLDNGQLMTWPYDEPQPDDWEDYYCFHSYDMNEPDMREWWEK